MSNKKCCVKKYYVCYDDCCENQCDRCCQKTRQKKCNCNSCCKKNHDPCCERDYNNKCECNYCSERRWCVRPCPVDPPKPHPPVPPIIPPIVPPIDPPVDPGCKPCNPCYNICCNNCYDPCCNNCYDPCCNNCYDPCYNNCCDPCYNNCCDPCCRRPDPKPEPKKTCGGLVPQSFATFANNISTTVPTSTPFSFNQVGTGTNDICLTSPSTILVKTEGTYNIVYSAGVSVSPGPTVKGRINVYANFVVQPNSNADFSIVPGAVTSCHNVVGTLQVSLQQNTVITLMNDSQLVGGGAITTCPNGTSPNVLSITRIK